MLDARPAAPADVAVLAGSFLLVIVQIALAAHLASLQYGYRWAASARDEPTDPPRVIVGRARRALSNLLETYPLFAAALLAVLATRRTDAWSLIGAHLYLWSRVVYLGLYLAGAPLIRSLVWNAALAGILIVAAQLFV